MADATTDPAFLDTPAYELEQCDPGRVTHSPQAPTCPGVQGFRHDGRSARSAILGNHGLLTVGATVDAGVRYFLLMERCAEIQVKAFGAQPIGAEPDRRPHDEFDEIAALAGLSMGAANACARRRRRPGLTALTKSRHAVRRRLKNGLVNDGG